MPAWTRIVVTAIWMIAADIVAWITLSEAESAIGMREFWLSAPVIVTAIIVFIAAPRIQATYFRDFDAMFLWLWVGVPSLCYAVLTMLVAGWFTVTGNFGDALAVPPLAFVALIMFPLFPCSAIAVSLTATAITAAILEIAQPHTPVESDS